MYVYTRAMSRATGVCAWCDKPFIYEVRGTATLYCSPEHRAKARARRLRESRSLLTDRRCPRCEQVKSREEFAGDNAPYCKPCSAAYVRGQRAADPDPLRSRRESLARYGLTFEQFDAMLAAQGGRCKICGTGKPGGVGGPRGWHVDHDHACCSTRKRSCGNCIRGIICTNCNHVLGNARDDPVILQAALDYLRAYREGHINPILKDDAAVTS